jgi:hypothetical protein
MSRVPSFGLLEVLIVAGFAGLVLLIGAIVLAVILNKRRQGRAQLNGSSATGNDSSEWTAVPKREAGSRGRQRRVVVLVLIVLVALALPLLAVGFGILSVIPVRQVREPAAGPQEAVVISAAGTPTGALGLNPTPTSTMGLTPTPGATSTLTPPSIQTSTDSRHRDFLDPDNTLSWAVVLPSMAGLALLAGAAGVALIATNWKRSDPRSAGVTQGARGTWAQTRVVILVLLSWFALSAFLVLDFLFTISLSWRFVALYAAFWVLVGALLLYDRPLRVKLVVLALLVIVLFAVRFVDWNSRKPFLKDLYRIQEGMTPAQVDRIMDGYMRANDGGPPGSDNQPEFGERGEIVAGKVTFRHTDEGWGDSDVGVVTFENGYVTETRFLPD